MASKSAMKSFGTLTRPARRHCTCTSSSIKTFSTSIAKSQEQYPAQEEERPRWSYTPERMKAPFSVRIKDPTKAWTVNEDPERLDQMYIRFLGQGGHTVLSEDLKWLAITHKSFDQGRRGFNDRLAFFGRRILELQTSLALINSPVRATIEGQHRDKYRRDPFEHEALKGLKTLNDTPVPSVLNIRRLADFASSVGIPEVTQWKPRYPENLPASGIDVVMTASLYGILGAISLHRGGDTATRIARERVLQPMGIIS